MNTINGSDVEMLPVGGGVIGITTDMLEEEIELGLFSDPEMLGWLTVAMSLSDLAAAGCDPLGVLIQISMPEHQSSTWCDAFFTGVQACCNRHGTFVLGGDTNLGRLRTGSCAIGKVRHGVGDHRRQLAVGHHLYATRPIGMGNRLAYARIVGHPQLEEFDAAFRPTVSFALGALAIELGGACIDTSDGFFPTLYTLLTCQPTTLGVEIDHDLTEDVSAFADSVQLPALAFLLGEVGDYGLIFSIPEQNVVEFERRYRDISNPPSVISVGRITERPIISGQMPASFAWSFDDLRTYRGKAGSVKERLADVLSLLTS